MYRPFVQSFLEKFHDPIGRFFQLYNDGVTNIVYTNGVANFLPLYPCNDNTTVTTPSLKVAESVDRSTSQISSVAVYREYPVIGSSESSSILSGKKTRSTDNGSKVSVQLRRT